MKKTAGSGFFWRVPMRLQKYLAECGVASRRTSESLIRDGHVQVNGQVIVQMGVEVDPSADKISVDGRMVTSVHTHAYYLFYKPRGVVCTLSDENGRKCISDFFSQHRKRLYPVGRLDMDSEGLLIVTDDGEYANRVMHPRYGVEKEYHVTLDKAFQPAHAETLQAGIDIGEEGLAVAKEVAYQTRADGRGVLDITLSQGKNREVRRMLEMLGYRVLRLRRTRIGALILGDLKPGESRRISFEQAQQAFLAGR
jgi:23S rRNA pseudouridine2605 synthase